MTNLPTPQRRRQQATCSTLFPVGSLYCHAFHRFHHRCRVFVGGRRFLVGSCLLPLESLVLQAGLRAQVLQAEMLPEAQVLQEELQPEGPLLQEELLRKEELLQARLRTDLQGRLRAEVLQADLLQEALQPERPALQEELLREEELLRADLCRRRTDLRLRRSGRRPGSPEGRSGRPEGPGSEGREGRLVRKSDASA